MAIDPAAPRGVIVGPTALISALPVLFARNGWNRVLTMTFEGFSKNFANGLPEGEKRAAYERQIVPTPGRIYFDGAIGIGTGVNWKNPDRAPLLLIDGGKDHNVTPGMVEATYRKQRAGRELAAQIVNAQNVLRRIVHREPVLLVVADRSRSESECNRYCLQHHSWF